LVLLCRQLDVFGRELLAVDGTRIKAVNNKDRNFTRASLTQFIKAADANRRLSSAPRQERRHREWEGRLSRHANCLLWNAKLLGDFL
jgi:hypothetical protein